MKIEIINFITEQKIATVCFNDELGKPYCINCFYVFDKANIILILKSSYGSKHEALTKPNTNVAGTILPEKINMANIKGIQFTGQVISESVVDGLKSGMIYSKTFPVSLLLPGYFWLIKLDFAKLTDNTMGFGNKIVWTKDSI